MKNKVVLIVAVLFGLLAAVLTRTYLSSKSDEFKKLTDRFNATHGTLDALCAALEEKMLKALEDAP